MPAKHGVTNAEMVAKLKNAYIVTVNVLVVVAALAGHLVLV